MTASETDFNSDSIGETTAVVKICTVERDLWSPAIGELMRILSPDEQSQARRFCQEEDRERFVIGRSLVRQICAEHLGTDPRAVQLRQGPFGKPYLAAETHSCGHVFEFNVSHSGNCVTMAWALGFPVGVDIEDSNVSRHTPLLDLAASAFSAEECAVMKSVSPGKTAATFYRIWVRKEAVLKAEGCGISAPLQTFSSATCRHGGIRWPDQIGLPHCDRTWEVVDFTPSEGHTGCLAFPPGAIIETCEHDFANSCTRS